MPNKKIAELSAQKIVAEPDVGAWQRDVGPVVSEEYLADEGVPVR